jgi:hypothetical protein
LAVRVRRRRTDAVPHPRTVVGVDCAEELAVKLFVDGTLPRGRDVRLPLATDSIGLVGISNRVPAAARVRLERFAAKLGAQDAAR